MLESLFTWLNDQMWGFLLPVFLLGTGVFLTVRLKFIQVRHFPRLFAAMGAGLRRPSNGISSFEAFATALASRVGTGNIAGVAVAITVGGPGAVFWMWIVALLGMATAMVESTLAQVFKHRDDEGLFRGGPAYYMERGLGKRWMGIVFCALLLVAYGFIFGAIQAHEMTNAVTSAFPVVPQWLQAAVFAGLTALVISGGLRRVSRTAEIIVPIMAVVYVAMAIFVILTNLGDVLDVFVLIFRGAFGLEQAAGGWIGYTFAAALQNGARRGLFSNEAGLGSAPNAAATADVPHPAQQGYVQALGVFIDTILICTATALMILLSGVYKPGVTKFEGAALTQEALAAEVGGWGRGFVAVALLFFSFTTIVAIYSFAETNVYYLFPHGRRQHITVAALRVVTVVMVVAGVYAASGLVWAAADVALGAMALVNLTALLMLSRIGIGVVKDYADRLKTEKHPEFDPTVIPGLAPLLEPGIWPAQQ